MKRTELYRFAMGSDVWTYTSSDSALVHGGETYEPATIGRGGIETKNEISRANIEVKMDIETPLAVVLMRTYNELVLSLTIFVKEGDDISTHWKGRFSSLKPEGFEVKLVMESIFTSLRRPGLRARYQKTCRHAVYARGCNLNKDDFAVPSEITALSGLIATIPNAALEANGWYLGGMIGCEDGSLRMIMNHSGNQITFSRPIAFLETAINNSGYGMNYGNFYGGVSVNIYPGCDRTIPTCEIKFNNLDNNGSFPWIPSKNPFGGSSIA